MNPLRRLILTHRMLAALLLAAALLIKVLVPAGYMLDTRASVLTVRLCGDSGQPGFGQVVIPLGRPTGAPGPAKDDGVCPFATLAMGGLLQDAGPFVPSVPELSNLPVFAPRESLDLAERRFLRPHLRGPPGAA